MGGGAVYVKALITLVQSIRLTVTVLKVSPSARWAVVRASRRVPPSHLDILLPQESFNDWGGRGCRKFVPVLGENGTKIAPLGDIFEQPPGEMR